MNPFEDDIFDNTNTIFQMNIEIWLETYGRKKNTFISGWEISEDELKNHLKNIKKKNGCNGTIKKIPDTNKLILQFQGDHIDFLKKYLCDNNVEPENIRIKG
jgi:translation initiation factor 1 (eIF-1/SUI1)